MGKESYKETGQVVSVVLLILTAVISFSICGCGKMSGYSNDSLYTGEVDSVYVEMFDSKSFYRGVEYDLTDAVAKRIEAESPYKIISSRDRADTVLSGEIVSINSTSFISERETGRSLEKGLEVHAVVNWKNLKTGELIIEDKKVSGVSTYSEWQNQGFDYASKLATNKLAQRIVELMEKQW